VIRLLPPLVMSEEEGERVVGILAPIIREFLAASAAQPKTAAVR
jgi:acetylornithine/succinyldiaminopimelate/putrescine aminotransferase